MSPPLFRVHPDHATEVQWQHWCVGTFVDTTGQPSLKEPFWSDWWTLDPAVYTVTSTSPLTVTPAVTCSTCGVRGTLTSGVWTPG